MRAALAQGCSAALLALFTVAVVLGCDGSRTDPETTPGRPDVFLIVLDAASARYFGTYGELRPTSPEMDRLAVESVVFDNAYSQSATTVPSTVSLLAGVRGTTHQMSLQSVLPDGLQLAAELFSEQGYRSIGFIGNPYAGAPELGLDHGYAEVVQLYALEHLQQGRAQEKSSGFRVTLPEDLNQAVEALLPTFADSEIFAYFHYLQPHKPYDPPPRFRALLEPEAEDCTCAGTPCPCGSLDWDTLHERFAAANQAGRASASTIGHLKTRYRANIRYVDAGVGALLEGMRRQGLYDESLIVLLADHGEAFFDHGHFGHNRTLYDDMVRIPLMMKFPRAAGVAPRRIDALVETVDVLPTLFDFLGFPIPVNFEGHSLWPLISDPEFEPDSAHQEVILATNRLDQHAIRVGPYKYIAHLDGREELYDLEADPGELHDLSEAEPQRARTLRARLAAAVDFESVKPAPARNTLRSDPEMEQLLEVLGYVRGDDEATEGSAASPGEPPAPVRD